MGSEMCIRDRAMATLALGLGGQALWTVTDLAAQGLMDPSRYIEAVLNP